MKFVLKYTKGKTIKVKHTFGEDDKMDLSYYVLSWLDNDGKKITSWSWSGNTAQERMTRKLQQIKTVIPNMTLEHEV